MQTATFLFSPSGRLSRSPSSMAPSPFIWPAWRRNWLTAPDIMTRAGLWPFVAAQAVLIWIWFVLHAKRLHDAGRAAGWRRASACSTSFPWSCC